jgi:lipid II:glycine glycyltransferase (peptidoglycan interpeptide bridge formation enzyme)
VTDAPEGELADAPTPDWDALAVDAPGGHVYQSVAWAEHRRGLGWRPRFHVAGAARTLVLTRTWPVGPGGSAYVPRGPAPVVDGAAVAGRLAAVSAALAGEGIDVVAADPEVEAADAAYADALVAGGWHPIEELQPSRHRIRLPIDASLDEAAALAAISKSSRQRIRAAERAGTTVVRHDARLAAGEGPGDGFRAPDEPPEAAFARFVGLLRATGERRDFRFGPAGEFTGWWQRGLAAGHVVYLEARADREPLAGLLLYRHGGRLSTVHSADRAEQRRAHPGVLHLLRWRALQLAIRARCVELDLGGADVPGARREPQPGEPTYGLYEHKKAFGGTWLELAGAHELRIRPWRYAMGRLLARATRPLRR